LKVGHFLILSYLSSKSPSRKHYAVILPDYPRKV
jgi:hypothetical protein